MGQIKLFINLNFMDQFNFTEGETQPGVYRAGLRRNQWKKIIQYCQWRQTWVHGGG